MHLLRLDPALPLSYQAAQMNCPSLQVFQELVSATKDKQLHSLHMLLDTQNIKQVDQALCREMVRTLAMDKEMRLVYPESVDTDQVDRILTVVKALGCQNVQRDDTSISFKRLSKQAPMLLRKKKEVQQEVQQEVQNPFAQPSGGDMIDEDKLLEGDTVEPPKEEESCDTKPRACKNCVCGRKEAEEEQDKAALLENIEQGKVTSSCGSCYLGDAFRCATCPYKGLPAFKPGEKIKLQETNDQTLEGENNTVQVQGGKVKIM